MKQYDVVTLLDNCVDLIVTDPDPVPVFGQVERFIQDYSIEMGGSTAIFACQAAKLGLRTAGIGVVGCDVFGDLILSRLNEAGVDCAEVRKDPGVKTGLGIALCRENDRAILTYTGSIDPSGLEGRLKQLIPQTRHLHIGSYYLIRSIQTHYPALIALAKENEVSISLDTNWDPEQNWDSGVHELIPYIDILMPNQQELMHLAGTNQENLALKRLSKFSRYLVVKRGANGATCHSDEDVRTASAVDATVVDAIGAGDSFDAGFVFGYLRGMSVEDCLRVATFCGSKSTNRSGGFQGQPRLEELEEWMKVNS